MRKKITILVVLTCLCLLACSNTLVMNFVVDSNYRLTKADISQFVSDTDKVIWDIDMHDLGGEYSKVDVSGWAFCETEHDNDGKTITLILKAKKSQTCWYTCVPAGLRADVHSAFPNAKGVYHGITCQFATFGLQDGVYDVFLYVKENDNTKGLLDTGIDLMKDGREISIKNGDANEIK